VLSRLIFGLGTKFEEAAAKDGLSREAVALGREVIWLHCYGERFVDPAANRPKQAPRLPKENAP